MECICPIDAQFTDQISALLKPPSNHQARAKFLSLPLFLYIYICMGRLPVVYFATSGVATPVDATLMIQFGYGGVFVGSGVFKSDDPARRAQANVQAVTHYSDLAVLTEISCGFGEAKVGLNLDKNVERYAN